MKYLSNKTIKRRCEVILFSLQTIKDWEEKKIYSRYKGYQYAHAGSTHKYIVSACWSAYFQVYGAVSFQSILKLLYAFWLQISAFSF